MMNPGPQTFVIVGGGLAGAKAAEALRDEGFDGKVLLIGAEPERPYERPPLSKDYLRNEAPREQAYVHSDFFYGARDIDLVTNTSVTTLDADRIVPGMRAHLGGCPACLEDHASLLAFTASDDGAPPPA
jgi:3-phenylpropionate/trans-cinnamate dioxygenase ferredoxin reductase subunit